MFSHQFPPAVPNQQGQAFMSTNSSQLLPVGQAMASISNPAVHNQSMQYSQSTSPLPPRPLQAAPSPQAMPMPFSLPNRPLTPESSQAQQLVPPGNPTTGLGAIGMSVPSQYTFVPSFTPPQLNVSASSQFQPVSQMHAPVLPVTGQPWMIAGGSNTGAVTSFQQPTVSSATNSEPNAQNDVPQSTCDWQEHTSADGRRYYYNKKTRQSSWEKPLELMSHIERADASTDWKEFTAQDGRKYYYNKITKLSKWTIPDALKLARENAEANNSQSQLPAAQGPPPAAADACNSAPSASLPTTASSPLITSLETSPVNPVLANNTTPENLSPGLMKAELQQPVPLPSVEANTTYTYMNHAAARNAYGDTLMEDIEEAKKGMAVAGRISTTPVEEKSVDKEAAVYASKQEAKDAFKALLESSNVESHWSWDQTMRVIVNDKRYGALRTLGERKQAFNEYLGQRKKLEAEERRTKQKRAREDFIKMLEESKELTSSTRWSKAVMMFEDEERFKAIERSRDREDLFLNYLDELQEKEKIRAHEEFERSRVDYRKFLESCDFIKVSSQWRKVQDRLEDDERCSRLEKIVRLDIFQDYIRDLEREEDEQKRIHREQLRRTERKNRDEFRRLLEEHTESGFLNARTHWREYYMKVKELPPYMAVASNTSGSTPKELFEDVAEELGKQYDDDKSRIKESLKLGQISVASSTTLDDFKECILEDVGSPAISDLHWKLVFEEMLGRIREKEEKEAKRRQMMVDEFINVLRSFKEIDVLTTWDECKQLLLEEYAVLDEEGAAREAFEVYIDRLHEKAREKEHRKREEKVKKERERKSRREEVTALVAEGEDVDVMEEYDYRSEKKREKDRERKHRRRHQTAGGDEDGVSDKDEKIEEPVIRSGKSRKHSGERRKSRKRSYTPESESEGRHRKHKRDHRDAFRRNIALEELEDGELGEDGEIW